MLRKSRRSFSGISARAVLCTLSIIAVLLLWLTPGWCASVHTIVLDAGHSLGDPGAISARNVGEYSFNKRMVDLLLDEFKKLPEIRFVPINRSGDSISLEQRVKLIAREKPDIFISIHHDSVQPVYLSKWIWGGKSATYCDLYSGFSIFYSQSGKQPAEAFALRH